MAEHSDIMTALDIALGEDPPGVLDPRMEQTVAMARTMIETIRNDQLDPIPRKLLHRSQRYLHDQIDPIPRETLKRAMDLARELPRQPSWFDRAVAMVLEPLFDDRPELAAGLRGNDLRQCTLAIGDIRLDLEIRVSEDVPGKNSEPNTQIRGQIDAERPLESTIPVVAFVADTNHVAAETVTRSDGRFDLDLPPGEYEFAFKLDGETQVLGRMEIP